MRISAFVLSGALLAVGSSAAMGSVYDEAVDGDLSGDRFNPTFIDFGAGLNTVTLQVVDSDIPSGDLDYFTFTIGAGQWIDSIIVLEAFNPNPGFDFSAFIGLAFDNYFDFDITDFSGDGLEGYVISESGVIGAESIGELSGGLTTLGEGDYTFWVQQGGTDLTQVSLGINVVPAPGVLGLFCAAGILGGRRRAR